jgi:hypothetical protein
MEYKEYLKPGDVVMIRQDIDFKPKMVVIGKAVDKDSNELVGIRCMWFTLELDYREAVFNTKDISKI